MTTTVTELARVNRLRNGAGVAFVPMMALLAVSAIWGAHAVVGKAVEAHMAAFPLTVWRFTLVAVCYLPLYHRVFRLFRLPRRQFLQLAASGLFWAVIYPLLYYQSLGDLAPVVSLLMVNTAPLFAAVIGWLFMRERLRASEWSGILISFSGIVLLVLDEWTGHASVNGVLLALMAAIAFASYTVLSRSLFQSLPLFDVLLGTSLWGAVLLWAAVLVSGQAGSVFGALRGLTPTGWLQFLYIVVFVGAVAYVLYGFGLGRLPAGISSALTFYPQAIFATIIQWMWLGIQPTLVMGASAVLILFGTWVMGRRPKRARNQSVSSEV